MVQKTFTQASSIPRTLKGSINSALNLYLSGTGDLGWIMHHFNGGERSYYEMCLAEKIKEKDSIEARQWWRVADIVEQYAQNQQLRQHGVALFLKPILHLVADISDDIAGKSNKDHGKDRGAVARFMMVGSLAKQSVYLAIKYAQDNAAGRINPPSREEKLSIDSATMDAVKGFLNAALSQKDSYFPLMEQKEYGANSDESLCSYERGDFEAPLHFLERYAKGDHLPLVRSAEKAIREYRDQQELRKSGYSNLRLDI